MKKHCEAGLPLFCSFSVVQSVSAVLMLEAMLYNKLLWRVPNRGAITIAWCGEISPRLQRSYLYFCKIVIMPLKVLNFNCIYNSLMATIWKITFVELFFSSAQNVFFMTLELLQWCNALQCDEADPVRDGVWWLDWSFDGHNTNTVLKSSEWSRKKFNSNRSRSSLDKYENSMR